MAFYQLTLSELPCGGCVSLQGSICGKLAYSGVPTQRVVFIRLPHENLEKRFCQSILALFVGSWFTQADN